MQGDDVDSLRKTEHRPLEIVLVPLLDGEVERVGTMADAGIVDPSDERPGCDGCLSELFLRDFRRDIDSVGQRRASSRSACAAASAASSSISASTTLAPHSARRRAIAAPIM
ncbi:hypothetical protein AXW83_15725 [Bosea sp. PAMC 26642]|nr:hypothetical protein AXW83_15725 [Bosea sp. PAMC 26642]